MNCHRVDFTIIGDEMQTVEIGLGPGDTIIGEAGAMNFMNDGIRFETKMGDGSPAEEGLLAGLIGTGKRLLTGEPLFTTHFTNTGDGRRFVTFAAPYPGKILALDLAAFGGEIFCQKDAFLCAAYGTEVGLAFTRRRDEGFFGGDGFILLRLVGDGLAFIHAGGTVLQKELENDAIRVDTGCIAAFTTGLNYGIERAGDLKSMFFEGEGLFLATLNGTGTIFLQTLPFSRLADRVMRNAPAGRNRSGAGRLTRFLGRLLDDRNR